MASTLEELRRQNRNDFNEMVKMHLSFLIEVTPEEWERIIAYVNKEDEEAERQTQNGGTKLQGKHSQTKYFTSTTSAKSNLSECSNTTTPTTYKVNNKFVPPKEKELASNIFGNPLSVESLRQAMSLVDFLNKDDNYKLEGIFRKSGTQERQQDLRYMLNNGAKVDLEANRFTPVDASCVLKEFIQKLPEPLLTTNHFELHYELAMTIKKETPPDEVDAKNQKRLKIIQLLLHLMPEVNRRFFTSIMALLNRVALALEVTKMDERSLATIFGQHILCPRNWSPKQVQKNIEIITDAMEFLLVNYDNLFSGPAELVMDARKKLDKYRLAAQTKLRHLDGDAMDKSRTRDQRKDHNDDDDEDDDDEEEEGDENNTVITFCQRKDAQETITETALAELYAQVHSMPDTPHKRKLIKKFNKQNGCGTPMQVTSGKHATSSRWKSFIPPILRPKS